MDFARKQLEKYGWKDGDGLGKECQGRAVALKPRLKSGKEGMGFDFGKDLTDTWWTKAYSDCLDRIKIDEDGVSIEQEDQEKDAKDNISPKEMVRKMYLNREEEERPIEKMRRRMMKANFTSFTEGGTLLTNGEVVSKRENNNDAESTKDKLVVKVLSDDELLKACGGRTAHKAARFGLKLNGKLARIAAQEESNNSKLMDHLSNNSSLTEIDTSLKLKKKKRKKVEDTEPIVEIDAFNQIIPSKKKKDKKNKGKSSAS